VRRASRSQAPIGCEVSGGHDSSAIFALARRLKEQGGLLSPDALGFTLTGIPGEISDEIEYARDVGRFLGVPIHEAECAVSDLPWFKANVAQDRDMPFIPNSQSMLNEVELVKQMGCRVLLDGEGGDEFVGGSPFVLHEMLVEGNWLRLAREMRLMQQSRGWKGAGRRLFRFGIRPLAPLAFDRAMRHIHRYQEPWDDHLGKGPHWVSKAVRDRLAELRDAARKTDEFWQIRHPVRRKMLRDMFSPGFDYLRDVSARLVARMGVELRTPMYSRRYIEFIFGLPEQMRFRDGYGKYIHLGALQKDLPQSVLQRRSKAEFSFTFDRQLKPLAGLICDEIPAKALPEICPEGLRNLYRNYEETAEGIWELWRVYGWYLLRSGLAGGDVPGVKIDDGGSPKALQK